MCVNFRKSLTKAHRYGKILRSVRENPCFAVHFGAQLKRLPMTREVAVQNRFSRRGSPIQRHRAKAQRYKVCAVLKMFGGDVWKPSDLSKMSQLRLGIKAGVDETPGTVYTEFSESPKNPKANKIRRRYYSWQNRK